METIISKAEINCHCSVIFGLLLHVFKAIRYFFLEQIEIPDDSDFYILFQYEFTYFWKLVESIQNKLHKFIDLFLWSLEVLYWKTKERCLFNVQLKTIKKVKFERLFALLMSLMGLLVFTKCISSISVHDKTDMLRKMALFENVDEKLFHAVEVNHLIIWLMIENWERSIFLSNLLTHGKFIIKQIQTH